MLATATGSKKNEVHGQPWPKGTYFSKRLNFDLRKGLSRREGARKTGEGLSQRIVGRRGLPPPLPPLCVFPGQAIFMFLVMDGPNDSAVHFSRLIGEMFPFSSLATI